MTPWVVHFSIVYPHEVHVLERSAAGESGVSPVTLICSLCGAPLKTIEAPVGPANHSAVNPSVDNQVLFSMQLACGPPSQTSCLWQRQAWVCSDQSTQEVSPW